MRRFIAPLMAAILAACAAETSSPAVADHFEVVSGADQAGAFGRPLDSVIVVRLVDDRGRPMTGMDIHWSVVAGGGSVETASTTTGADGLALGRWVLGIVPGDQHLQISANGIAPLELDATAGGLRAIAIAVTGEAACALDSLGAPWCWGYHGWYQADPNATYGAVPVRIDSVHAFTSIAGGIDHFCALTAAGQAWCWGAGSRGELGIGATVPATIAPQQVAGGHAFASITAGWYTTCGIDLSGQAWCWGTPGDGSLGTGGISELAPAAVQQGAVTFASISLGYEHICALEPGGQAWCWGHQDIGQLGDSTGGGKNFPQKVAGATLFRSVAAGDHFTCGIAMDSSLRCWGGAPLSPYAEHLTPTLVDGGGFGQILGDDSFLAGIRSHRPVTAGFSYYIGAPPELGTATLTEISGGMTSITDLALRWATICMIRSDEAVFCVGDVPGYGNSATPVGIPAP